MTTLANHWAERGWDIHIVTLNQGPVPSSYPLHPHVKHLRLQRSPVEPSRLVKLWRSIRKFSLTDPLRSLGKGLERLVSRAALHMLIGHTFSRRLRVAYQKLSHLVYSYFPVEAAPLLLKSVDRIIRSTTARLNRLLSVVLAWTARVFKQMGRFLWHGARRIKHLGVYCWERQATGGWINRFIVFVFDRLPTRLRWEVQLAQDLREQVMETEPDVVISFMTGNNVRTIRALHNTDVPVIVSERTAPERRFLHNEQLVEMRKKLYPKADCLVVQTTEAKEYYEGMLNKPVQVIPNPVPKIHAKPDADGNRLIVAVGRLVYEKGYDLLIQSFSRIHKRNPGWRLEIWGDGPLRRFLAREIEKAGLRNGVILCGNTSRVEDVFARADIYVLSSRYEGFPNALCEAMSCGVAPVAFDCPVGPRAIITHKVDGLLVPANNIDAMGKAMARLIADEAMRKQIGKNARKVAERYSVDQVASLWEETISEYAYAGLR
jgi:GalNAc-alpha-(1->4)-GalNAc-alpha-(1->3)-diNAcBac-PP-undecaprenol alpha-1,4-N-acetyl-D-galactosaminyltransferase